MSDLYIKLLSNPKFFSVLHKYDCELASKCHEEECHHCGQKLDYGNFYRKPRGVALLEEEAKIRFSLCCRGCRKRLLPPSLRFLSRKVYLSAVICLITAMTHGLCNKRIAVLRQLIGVSRRTLNRWRHYWTEIFPNKPFWIASSGFISGSVNLSVLPQSLIEYFQIRNSLFDEAMKMFLKFISPLSSGN